MIFNEIVNGAKNEFSELSFVKGNSLNGEKGVFENKLEEEMIKAKEEGFNKGYEEYSKKLEELLLNFSNISKKFEEEIIKIKKEFESKVIEISFVIAEKILSYELEREGYIKMFNNYANKSNNIDLKIVISKDDYLKLEKKLSENIDLKNILEISKELKEGEVLVKMGDYIRDITPFNQLQILKNNFMGI